MKKDITLKTYEIVALDNWYAGFYENKISELPISIQWRLAQNMAVVIKNLSSFYKFREDLVGKIRQKFFNDEKAETVEIDGVEQLKVKEEFLDDYKNEVNKVNKELEKIGSEENTFTITEIDVDALVDGLPDTSTLTIKDISMIAVFK